MFTVIDDLAIYSYIRNISSYEHTIAHQFLQKKRLPDTCQWLISHTFFKEWLAAEDSVLLLCTGIVGSGKTMLATLVVQMLLERSEKKDNTVVYYYVEQAGPHNLTATAVLRSFIRQLLLDPRSVARYRSTPLLSKIERLFRYEQSTIHDIELLDIFDFMVKDIPEIAIVIDGLHEMTREEARRVCDFVDHFLSQIHGPTMRIAIFNRSQIGDLVLKRRLPTPWHIELNLQILADDIATFVHRTVDYLMEKERELSQDQELVAQVKQELIDRGSRMFLWIHLQILSLWRNCTNDQEIEDALETLPEGLDAAYVRCLEQIDSRPTPQRYAPDIFKWLALAERPLRESEVQEAISLKFMQEDWNDRRVTRIPIADHCANLVEVTGENSVVRFIHPSVRDFLISNVPQDLSRYAVNVLDDSIYCGEQCVQYLAMPIFRMALTESSRQHAIEAVSVPDAVLSEFPLARGFAQFWYPTEVTTKPLVLGQYRRKPPRAGPDPHADQFTFLSYARKYWLIHARQISESSRKWGEFKRLVLSPNPIRGLQPWAESPEPGAKHLRELFKYGLRSGFVKLLEITINCEKYKRLSVDLFNAVLSDSGWHCLHFAAAFDQPTLVEYLLPSVKDVDVADYNGNTALHIAASLQDGACAALLCEAGADVLRLGMEQVTPLNMAVLRDSRVALRSMLLKIDDVDFFENIGMPTSPKDVQAHETPLEAGQAMTYLDKAAFDAVSLGHAYCLDLLLEKGVSLSSLNHHGWSMLHVAVAKVKLNIIEVLLTRGADVNAVDSMGRTPLHVAVILKIHESLAIARALLKMPKINTAIVLKRMLPTYSPLGFALELFLRNWLAGYRDKINQSSWQYIVKDVQQYYDYPLPRTSENPEAEIELLHLLTTVEYHARVGRRFLASERQRHRELFDYMLKTLPQTVVAQFVTCGYFSYFSPEGDIDFELLHKAISYGDLEIVRPFLNLGSNSHLRDCDKKGRNSLHAAVIAGSREVVKLVLSTKDSASLCHQSDENGQTPLHLCAVFSQVEIMQDLIEEEPGLLHGTDKNGQTPFHLACIYGNEKVRESLNAAGAGQDRRDNMGMTAEDHLIQRQEFEKIPFSAPWGGVILLPTQSHAEEEEDRVSVLAEESQDLWLGAVDDMGAYRNFPWDISVKSNDDSHSSSTDRESTVPFKPQYWNMGSESATSSSQVTLSLRTLNREYWMKDICASSCFCCNKPFTMLRRKHHCRLCGVIFDTACMTYIDGSHFESTTATIRICKACASVVESYQQKT